MADVSFVRLPYELRGLIATAHAAQISHDFERLAKTCEDDPDAMKRASKAAHDVVDCSDVMLWWTLSVLMGEETLQGPDLGHARLLYDHLTPTALAGTRATKGRKGRNGKPDTPGKPASSGLFGPMVSLRQGLLALKGLERLGFIGHVEDNAEAANPAARTKHYLCVDEAKRLLMETMLQSAKGQGHWLNTWVGKMEAATGGHSAYYSRPTRGEAPLSKSADHPFLKVYKTLAKDLASKGLGLNDLVVLCTVIDLEILHDPFGDSYVGSLDLLTRANLGRTVEVCSDHTVYRSLQDLERCGYLRHVGRRWLAAGDAAKVMASDVRSMDKRYMDRVSAQEAKRPMRRWIQHLAAQLGTAILSDADLVPVTPEELAAGLTWTEPQVAKERRAKADKAARAELKTKAEAAAKGPKPEVGYSCKSPATGRRYTWNGNSWLWERGPSQAYVVPGITAMVDADVLDRAVELLIKALPGLGGRNKEGKGHGQQ